MVAIESWHFFPPPGLIEQIIDGVPEGGNNCAPATWVALLISQHWGKRPAGTTAPWYPTAQSLRNLTGDHSGGILPSTLDATVNRYYKTDLIPRITTVDTVESLLRQRYPIGLLIDYGPVDDTPGFSGSPGFRDAHSIPLFGTTSSAWLDADPLYDGRRAGIPKGPKWLDRDVLIKAGGGLNLGGGVTVREKYGPGKLYIVQTTRPYVPGAPPAIPAGVVTSAPTTAEERANVMIRAAWGVTSSKVQRLVAEQPLFASPGGPRVTKLSKAASVSFLGKAGPNWGVVLVRTGVPYTDKVARPTGLYVPLKAGPVLNR